jgi:hypothetical protein
MRVAATASGSEVGDVIALWMGRLFIYEQTINENREPLLNEGFNQKCCPAGIEAQQINSGESKR